MILEIEVGVVVLLKAKNENLILIQQKSIVKVVML
jgi:hypothetical protein